MIIAGAFLLGIAATFIGAAVYAQEAANRLEAATDRLESLAREQYAHAAPVAEPGPLTVDTMEPEDARVIKQRNRRGYFS